MISKFRPIWSLDIERTESWLSDMAARGYHFAKIKLGTATFVFELGEPRETIYRIAHDQVQATSLSEALIRDGWRKVFSHRGYYVVANDKPLDDIKTFPARDGLFRRNRTKMFILGGVSLHFIFCTLMFVMVTLVVISAGGSVYVVPSPLWALTAIYWAFVIGIIGYWVRLTIVNRRVQKQHLGLEHKASETAPPRSERVVRWRYAWQYSPDRLEQWLEKMELEGLNLHRVSKLGVKFLFARGSSRRVKYCADYRTVTEPGYFDTHRDAGWDPVFTSLTSFASWTIWAQEYAEGEEPPELYSDKSDLLKHARRVTVTHACIFAPLLVINAWNMKMMWDRSPTDSRAWTTLGVAGFASVMIGMFTVKTWLYYRRLKQPRI